MKPNASVSSSGGVLFHQMFRRSPRHLPEVRRPRVISSRPDWLFTSALSSATTICEADSACLQTSSFARLLVIPVMPSTPKALQSDCPAKPRLDYQLRQEYSRSSILAVHTHPAKVGIWPSFSHVLLQSFLPMALSILSVLPSLWLLTVTAHPDVT